jgi:outer membrane beta-barrel protein
MKRTFIISVIIFLLCFNGTSVFGETVNDEKVFAVQERAFHRDHEIGFTMGTIVNDDFYDVYPLGIKYTFNINDYLAWEVVRGEIMMNQEKELKGILESDFGATPSQFAEPQYMIHSHLVIKPFYGKDSVFNRGILNHESYFLIGGGIVNYEKQYSYGEPDTENAISISLGYGIKYFLSRNVSLNLEIRDLINIKEEKTENNIYCGLGLSFRFNISPRKPDADPEVEKLKHYLGND